MSLSVIFKLSSTRRGFHNSYYMLTKLIKLSLCQMERKGWIDHEPISAQCYISSYGNQSLIYRANQLTCFYMKCNTELKWVRLNVYKAR